MQILRRWRPVAEVNQVNDAWRPGMLAAGASRELLRRELTQSWPKFLQIAHGVPATRRAHRQSLSELMPPRADRAWVCRGAVGPDLGAHVLALTTGFVDPTARA
ncbi:hypothetical protein HS125_16650 [bacterium]|nr:hypothetical protein [bacterium]